MKKGYKILLAVMIMFCALPLYVFAGASPEKMQINAEINYDGSMTVEEDIAWTIEESINGVYRDVVCFNPENEWNSAEEIHVHSVIVDGKTYNYSEETLENGDSGMYNLNRIEGGAQIKIFHPSDEYRVRTVIKYTLTDVVTKYADIAELYWNFLGKGWAGGLENATIRITLPESSETLKIFGHGPLDGYCEIIDQSTVEFHIPYLRMGEAVDARVLFDKDIVYATKFKDKDMYEEIMAEELVLAKKADDRRKRAEIATIGAWITSGIIIVIMFVTNRSLNKKIIKLDYKLKYYRELPEDYGVPVMNYLLHKYHKDNENMLATLMDLVRKKYIKIYPVTKEGKTKPVDYELKLIKEDLSELNEVEKHYIQKLIFVDCTNIRLKELKKKNTRSTSARTKAARAYSKWQKLIEKEYKACKFKRTGMDKVSGKALAIVILCFIVSFGLTITFGVLENEDAAGGLGIAAAVSIYYIVKISNTITTKLEDNEKAVEHKEKWKAFKRFLKDFSKMEEKDYGSIVLWEHYLVYAIGLGIADKVLKQLKDIYPDIAALDDTYSGIYHHTSSFNSFSSSFNSTSTGAFTYSSSTGSGGGFSGGGGGRRRRWWRRRILIRQSIRQINHKKTRRYLQVSSLFLYITLLHVLEKSP